MSTDNGLPDWVKVGGKVGEEETRGWSHSLGVTTVERLTDTQVVCANGNRYRRSDLHRVGTYGKLLPVTDRRIVESLAAKRVYSTRRAVDRVLGKCGDRSDVSEMLAALAESARLIAETRARIERLTRGEVD